MKALTVWQPWASLIAAGHKPYEFRGWKPPKYIVGERIAIHAGARKVQKKEVMALLASINSSLGLDKPALTDGAGSYLAALPIINYPRSCIVCTAVVLEGVRGDECARRLGMSVNDSDRKGTFNWGWPLTDIKNVPNIPFRGAQGLWNLPEGLIE